MARDGGRQGEETDQQAGVCRPHGGPAGYPGTGLARGDHRRLRGRGHARDHAVASWAWGFTLNRVSLFALIFSIGILVDDAIVVVENIHRHLSMGPNGCSMRSPAAVDEVGGPTILATFTVIAALLPMAFVSGLMGPYMSPIPINASLGMLISLVVAFVFTPWMSNRCWPKWRRSSRRTPMNAEGGPVWSGFSTVSCRRFCRGEAVPQPLVPAGQAADCAFGAAGRRQKA